LAADNGGRSSAQRRRNHPVIASASLTRTGIRQLDHRRRRRRNRLFGVPGIDRRGAADQGIEADQITATGGPIARFPGAGARRRWLHADLFVVADQAIATAGLSTFLRGLDLAARGAFSVADELTPVPLARNA